MKTINVIATTISGSIKDWKKIDKIKTEFEKHYSGKVEVFIVNSHQKAKAKAQELIANQEQIIVSAGGSGTFAHILEGCRLKEGYPKGLRLAFLRKGSADLLGKVLNMPDKLEEAAKIMVNSIVNDKTIESDVIEVNIDGRKLHFIGYGGLGVFGIVPYFTESRLKKYYKGVLSYLFGDRGPFLFGVNLAILKFYTSKLIQSRQFTIFYNSEKHSNVKLSNILFMNGDLGKDYPIAKGMPLATNDFQVTLLADKGIITCYKQLICAWKGELEKHKDKLGVEVFRTSELMIESHCRKKFMVNVDGALHKTKNPVSYRISDRIKLVTA